MFSEIPVPSLKKVTQWLDIFPSEEMEMQCGMDGSNNWIYTWYKDGQDVQPGNEVSFGLDKTSLSISSASSSHGGQYNCSAKLKSRDVKSIISSGLTFSVYGEIFLYYFILLLFCTCYSSNIFKYIILY